MSKYLIITNDSKDVDYSVTKQVKALLEESGNTVYLCEKDKEKFVSVKELPEELDYAIIIGGDGSFIDAAKALYDRDIKFIGINMGTLGYLTEVELHKLEPSLKKLMNGEYKEEHRLMLEGFVPTGASDVALNEIIVTRKGPLRAIRFKLFVNNILLNSYEADGIIVSTPTGSTAYNLSAGGPIVEPTASLMVVTPICPHSTNARSVVLSGDDEILIEIEERRSGQIEEVEVFFDGRNPMVLHSGDMIKIKKSNLDCKIAKLSNKSFYEVYRMKMKGN